MQKGYRGRGCTDEKGERVLFKCEKTILILYLSLASSLCTVQKSIMNSRLKAGCEYFLSVFFSSVKSSQCLLTLFQKKEKMKEREGGGGRANVGDT